MPTRLVFALLFTFVCAVAAEADGCYVPRIDPASHARDISEPDQKALVVYDGSHEDLILQVSYKGDVSDFVWLVPVPSVPRVSRCDFPVFHILHEVTAPRLKYWVDPDAFMHAKGGSAGGIAGMPSVDVLDEAKIGIYDTVVLRARNAQDLLLWLRRHGYMVSRSADSVLSDYIRKGWVFTAARINRSDREKSARNLREGTLESLQLEFSTSNAVYPLKISSLNPGGTKLLLYVLSKHRMRCRGLDTECANYFGLKYFAREGYGDYQSLPSYTGDCDFLTKMTGDLTPEQMTADIHLTQARADVVLLPQPVWAPLPENLWRVFWFALLPPESLLTCLVAYVIVGATPFGRRRRMLRALWNTFRAIVSVSWRTVLVVTLFSEALSIDRNGYWQASLLAMVCVVVLWARSVIRKILAG